MEVQAELEELFEDVMAGDQLAREQFYCRYESRLRCTLWTFSRDTRYGHSDMVQSAFCHLFEDAQAGKIRLQSEQEVFGLLVRYAHNRARTGQRKDRTAQKHAARYVEARHAQQASPGEALEVAELADYMSHQLSPAAAQIIRLKQSGESFDSMANLLGKSHSAVEKIYYRTITHLRERARQLQLV